MQNKKTEQKYGSCNLKNNVRIQTIKILRSPETKIWNKKMIQKYYIQMCKPKCEIKVQNNGKCF